MQRKNGTKYRLVTALTMILALGSLSLIACDEPVTEYTVTFMHGDRVHESQKVEEGKNAVRPVINPTEDDYEFQDWYEEVNADKTGNGLSFDFGTEITKDLTLYAGFKKVEEATITVMARIDSEFKELSTGDKIASPRDEYHEIDRIEVVNLTELSVEPEFDELYEFRDISTLEGVSVSEDKDATTYMYDDEENRIYYVYDVYDDGTYYANFYDYDYETGLDVFYYGNETILIADYYDNRTEESDNIRFITNNGVKKSYIYVEDTVVANDGELTLTKELCDQYLYNGVIDFDSKSKILDKYLEAVIELPNGQHEYIYIEEGETYNLPEPYGSNPNTTTYSRVFYDSVEVSSLDFTHLSLDDFPGFDELYANYSDSFNTDWFIFDHDKDIDMKAQTYDGKLYGVQFRRTVDEVQYLFALSVENDEIIECDFNVTDAQGITYFRLVLDENLEITAAYKESFQTLRQNTFMVSDFTPYKLLDETFYIMIHNDNED